MHCQASVSESLLLRELKLRGLIERLFIVCPANLAVQWEREMKAKFNEKLTTMKLTLVIFCVGAGKLPPTRKLPSFQSAGSAKPMNNSAAGS